MTVYFRFAAAAAAAALKKSKRACGVRFEWRNEGMAEIDLQSIFKVDH